MTWRAKRRQHVAKLRAAFTSCLTESDIADVVATLLKLAIGGDVAAIKLVLERAIGKPEAFAPILNENPRGVLLARDELSGWLAGFDKYSGKSSASLEVSKWLEIYNCESITIDRKSGDEKFLFVHKPSVSICGGIQPSILARCLTNEHKENGLQSRRLMTFPLRQPKEWREDETNPATQLAYAGCIHDLFELHGTLVSGGSEPVTLKLSPAARSLFVDYVNQTGKEQAAMQGHLASQWSRLEEIPARLAITLHCAQQVTTGVVDL